MFFEPIESFTLGQDLKNWAARLLPRDYPQVDVEILLAFRSWVGMLPGVRTEHVAFEIAGLCMQPGFDLGWFRDALRHPEYGSPQSRTVVFFGLAVYQRWTCQDHMQILSWIGNPHRRRNKDFGWQLYLLLVEAGFTSIPGEFLMAHDAVRAGIIEKAIIQACELDFHLLVALTQEILFLQNHNRYSQTNFSFIRQGQHVFPVVLACTDIKGIL